MNKTNRILLGVFFVQVVLLVGLSLGLAREDAREHRITKAFENLDPAKITKFKILGEPRDGQDNSQPPQPEVELLRAGTGWVVSSAEGYPADQSRVQEFLDKLVKLRNRGEVLRKSAFHRKLEVADDKYQRQITLTLDGKEIKFYLGTSPGFKSVHFRKAGSDEVLQVGDISTFDVGARPWDWVDRQYFKIPEADIWGLSVSNKKGAFKLDKNASGAWSIQGSDATPTQATVDDFVRKASNITLEEPVGKTEKDEYGFANPTATITLSTGTSSVSGKMPPEIKTEVIRIGAKQDKENRYFVKSSSSNYVVSVAGWSVEPFVDKGSNDLVNAPSKDAPKVEGLKKAKAAKK